MDEKNRYKNGNEAIKKMRDLLGDIWRQNELLPFYAHSLEDTNKLYKGARDAAMIFGEDISKYPKRIRFRTAGSEIVEGVRTI